MLHQHHDELDIHAVNRLLKVKEVLIGGEWLEQTTLNMRKLILLC